MDVVVVIYAIIDNYAGKYEGVTLTDGNFV